MSVMASKELKKISKPELLAVLLYARGPKGKIGEEIVGTTKLTKLLFLVTMETDMKKYLDNDMNFIAYKYGPFDSEIYDVLEVLINYGIIKSSSESNIDNYYINDIEEKYDNNTVFKLTDIGVERTKEIIKLLPKYLYDDITSIKRIHSRKQLISLLHYVYNKYPKYAEQSEAQFID